MLKHVKGVSGYFSYISVWEIGFLPILYQAVEDWFQSGSQYSRGNFVEGGQEGDGPQVFDVFGVFVLLWD